MKTGKTLGMKLRKAIWIIFKYFMLCLASFVAVLPIVSCVITAFKTPEEYANTNVMQLPKSWLYFTNFVDAWKKANMGRAFLNSLIVLVCVLIGSILIGAMLAYVLNRFKFVGNGLIRNLFLFASLLPGIAMQVSVYAIMTNLGFINHLWGYIIVMMGTDIISVTIFIQFFEKYIAGPGRIRHCGRLHLFRCIFQNFVSSAQARDYNRDDLKGCGHLQRILYGQPVFAEQG